MVIQIPVALWATENSSSPLSSAQITCIDTTKDGSRVLVGLRSGVLCICRIGDRDDAKDGVKSSTTSPSNFSQYAERSSVIDAGLKERQFSGYLEPYLALCGHSTAICALTETFFTVDGLGEAPPNAVVSASEDGTMVSWDPRDGRALCSAPVLAGKATQLKTLRSGRHVVACGHFPNIVVVTAATLVAVRVLPTHASAFIVSGALFFFTASTGTLGEGFLTLSMDGTIESFALRTTKTQNRASIGSNAGRSPSRGTGGTGMSAREVATGRQSSELSDVKDNNRFARSNERGQRSIEDTSPARKQHVDLKSGERSDGRMLEGNNITPPASMPSSPSTSSNAHTAPIKRARMDADNAVAMCVNTFTNGTVLVVRDTVAEIFLLSGLEFLIGIPRPSENDDWAGGAFVAHAEVVLWSTLGVVNHYRLPADELDIATHGRIQLYHPVAPKSQTPEEKQARKLREQRRATDPNARATLLHRYVLGGPRADEAEGGTDGAMDGWNGLATCVVNAQAGMILGIDEDNGITAWRIAAPAPDAPTLVSLMATPPAMARLPVVAQRALTWADPSPRTYADCAEGDPSGEMFAEVSCCMQMPGDKVVFGYHGGAIRALTLPQLLDPLFHDLPQEAAAGSADPPSRTLRGGIVLQAHTRAVTCFLHPFSHGSHVDSKLFLSGAADSMVHVWNGTQLHHTFNNQSAEISSIFCPPASSVLLRQGCVCVISRDHSLAVYSIEMLSCMHLISGHSAPIEEVRWRCADDYIIVWCADRAAYVWQLSTGHLDRKATGQVALDILANCDAIDQQTQSDVDGTGPRIFKNEHGVDVHLLPVGAPQAGRLPVLLLDVEKLIAALSRVRGGSHSGHRASGAGGTGGTGGTSGAAAAAPNGGVRANVGAVAGGYQSRTRYMLRMVSSILLHWKGHDGEAVDGVVPKEVAAYGNLKLRHRPCNYTFGLVDGKHNIFSVALPVPYEDQGTRRWCASSHVSTVHLLGTTALLHALHRTEPTKALEHHWLAVMADFTNHTTVTQTHAYKKPALLRLVLLWEHWQHDVQRVARAQLQVQLNSMTPAMRETVVQWASTRIPSSVRDHVHEDKLAAVVLLGIIAHAHRGALKGNSEITKRMAHALTEIVENDKAGAKHRAAAAEVLGQAYDTLKHYCDLSSVFLTLTELASTASTSGVGAVPLHALKNLASNNIHQFVDAINTQIFVMAGTTFRGHNSMLKVLRMLVKTHPSLLSPELSKIVDVIVRCFDPGTPKIRESCFKSAMGVLHEMCQAYATMGMFEARLAVGTDEGFVNIYDLKSATRWQSLPAHPSPVTSISFSMDGRMLASFSVFEKAIKVWHVVGSFFGMLSSAPKCIGTFKVSQRVDGLAATDAGVSLVWTSKKVLRLVAPSDINLEFKIS
eukprot:m.1205734 g.1205734  ORF g.1205734 m.1205734 type:complete len:1393 (-) comp24584_c0_seq1:316-4494(-)